MVRKSVIRLSILLIAVLSVLAGACGSEEGQKEGGGKKGGSSSKKGEQAGSSGGDAQGGGELTHIGRKPKLVYGNSYVGPLAEIFGDVSIGEKDFIASNTVLRAAPGNKVEIGDESNVQDNVTVRGYRDSATIGDRTSLTHHAVVEDSQVGDSVFVGYGSEIRNSEVGDESFIYHGARIEGSRSPRRASWARERS